MEELHASRPKSPGEFIREELETRGWTQADLAKIIDRPLPTVNGIIQGKHAILPEMAIAIGEAFGTGAELWMQREMAFRLSLAKEGTGDIRKRAKVYEIAPIKEIQKRGWIPPTDDVDQLEQELIRFLEKTSLDADPAFQAVFRKTHPNEEMTISQRAWCARVRQIARTMMVGEFKEGKMTQCERDLRKIAPYSPEVRKVPGILAAYGIRFVVVEPLANGKVDGMTTWLDDLSPVIGMAIRFDRIDSFWHTLCHEWSHVRHRDAFSIDTDFVADSQSVPVDIRPPMEKRADDEAAAMLIPPKEIESFISRVGPLYSKERINQFANRIKIHPGIIVGQLQHRGEIGYSANREMLVKIRHIVTPVAITDGWGHTIDSRNFE